MLKDFQWVKIAIILRFHNFHIFFAPRHPIRGRKSDKQRLRVTMTQNIFFTTTQFRVRDNKPNKTENKNRKVVEGHPASRFQFKFKLTFLQSTN